MNTLSISFTKSRIFNGFDAIAVRCAYLLSTKVIFSGNVQPAVFLKESFDRAHNSVESKLNFALSCAEKHPELNVPVEQIQDLMLGWQQTKNIKHKNSQQIINEKKLLRAIDAAYTLFVTFYTENFNRSGFGELKHTLGKGLSLLTIIEQDTEHLRTPAKDLGNIMKLSELLLDRCTADNINEVYLATRDFSNFLKEQNIVNTPFLQPLNSETEIMSAPLFKLPHVGHLKASELESIRSALQDATEKFRAHLHEWCGTLMRTEYGPLQLATFQQYFKNKIAPQLEGIQKALNADERLQHSDRAHNQAFEIEVNLYLCPVGLWWQYLTAYNSLPAETYDVMKVVPDFEQQAQAACLVLQCAVYNLEGKVEDEKPEQQSEPVLTKRKTLNLD